MFERTYLRNVATRDEEGSPEPEPGRLSAGSGLGLAIVRELVKALAGRVEVTSSPGEGNDVPRHAAALAQLGVGSDRRAGVVVVLDVFDPREETSELVDRLLLVREPIQVVGAMIGDVPEGDLLVAPPVHQ